MNKTNCCPRCGGTNLIDYIDISECSRCNLEFLNSSLRNYEPENILSIQEIMAFLKIIKNSEDYSFTEYTGRKVGFLSLLFKTKSQSVISLLLLAFLVFLPIFSF